ncbi:hypothetical protein Hdeb2414_s0015g00448641 [Helianthus debilis subsp. tardiflorus]
MLAVFRKEKCEMIRFTHYRANDGRRKRRAKMVKPLQDNAICGGFAELRHIFDEWRKGIGI